MWGDVHNAVFSLISSLCIGGGIYKNFDVKKTRIILFIVISTITNVVANMFLPGNFSDIVYVISTSILLDGVLTENRISTLAISMLTAYIFRFMTLMYFTFMFVLFNDRFRFSIDGFYAMVYSLFFINVITIVVMWIYAKYRNVKNMSKKVTEVAEGLDFLIPNPNTFSKMYIALSILNTFTVCMWTYIEYLKGDTEFYVGGMFIIGMYSVLMLLLIMMIQGLMKNEVDLSTKKDEVETLRQYTGAVEDLLDEMQRSRHDYKNMILSIQDFVVEKRFDELEEYFKNEILKSENMERVSKNIYMSTKHIKNLALKSLVNAKLNEALSNGIHVEISIFSNVDIVSVPALDMCRILGNFLDNAIDAAKESEERVISFSILKNDNQYSITLCNSFVGEIDISKVWEKGYSSKGRNRGLGLPIVKKLIEEEHTNILLNTEIVNGFFVQDITVIELDDVTELL